MCGIAGLIASEPIDRGSLDAMSRALRHRGPDDEGVYIDEAGRAGLVHRRLSIIDLSAAGHQPMASGDGRSWITYNGEVYNYADLRSRLAALGHTFRSKTDTEVVLQAFQQWGPAAVVDLRGMFAFAVWDSARRRLFAARDHTGIKPLFYYWDGRTFAFASELAALTALPGIDLEIDRTAVFDFLTHLCVPTPKTIYRRIAKLPAGSWLEFDGRDVTVQRYWDVPLEEDPGIDEARAVSLVRESIAEAVQLNLVSDVPVGVFLSGGLDSSTIVAEASRLQRRPLATYSIGFDAPGHSETEYAREVAEAFRTDHHEQIVSRADLPASLECLARMYGEPYADGSALPTFHVSRLAVQDVKVVLSGDGGDEVFAGYSWHRRWMRAQRYNRIPPAVRRGLLAPVGGAWPPHARGGRVKRWLEDLGHSPFDRYARQMELFSPAEKRAILRPEWCPPGDYDDYWSLRRHWREDVNPITRLQYLDLKTYLPDDILTKVDRASMRVSLEVRPPLLDHKLIEQVFRIPSAIRFKHGDLKYLLKRAMAPVLPPRILSRPKKGFSSPLMQWLAAERPWVTDRLAAHQARDARTPTILNASAAAAVTGHLWGPKMWALLILDESCRS